MSKDLEEFLRKAAARKNQRSSNNPPQSPPPSQQSTQQQRSSSQPPRQQSNPQQNSQRPSEQSSLSRSEPRPVPSENRPSVGHLKSSVNTRDVAAHASDLGAVTRQADERLVSHQQQAFGANSLMSKDTTSAAIVHSAAVTIDTNSIFEALRSPQKIQQSIILGEILNRPTHLWDD